MADKKSVLRTSLDDPNAESIARLAVTPQITPQAQYALTDAASDSQFVRGLRTGAAGLSAGNYANTALSQEAAGNPEWKIARDLALKTQAEAQGYAPRVQSLRDIGGLNDAYDYATGALGQGIISMAPTIGGALVGSAAGPVGRYLGGAYAGYGVERGEAALNQYADPVLAATDVAERNRAASGKALVNTALEAFVPAGVAKTLTRAPVKGAARRIENDLVTEGLTETGQEVVGYGAEKYLDPNRQLDPMDLADAFAGGALTGAGVSAGAHGASHAMKAAADKLTAEAPPIAPIDKPVAKTPVQERDFVADTFSKMSEVAKSAATPEEYLDRSFGNGNEDNAIRDLRPDTEDPGILNAADPEAALLDRDAQRKERSAVYAAELLEDPTTPQVIKERIAAIGDDFSDPDAQNFVAQSLVELRKNQRITDTVNSLVDTPDIEAPVESGVKKNLQDTSPTEQAAFNKLIFDSLTDEAKANETVRQRLPDLANKLLAYAARTGELTPQDMKTLSRVRDGFDLFADPDATAAKLLEYTGVPRDSNSFLERIKQATNAQTDIKKPNSFLYTSLSGAAKDTLTPRQMQQVAKLVDEVTLSDKKRGDDIVESLTPIFGSRENVNAVLDYYWQQNKSNTKYDPNETLVDGDTGEEVKFESGMHEQEDTPEASYHFAYAKGRRPFRAFVGEQINEGGMRRRVRESTKAALTLRNASPNNSHIRPIKMSEYVRETGRNPLDEMKRVRADIEGLIKEQKSHKREDRSKQIAEHEGTLSLMKDAYQKNGGGEKGASAALDLFEVLKVEGQEKNDLVTTDEELAKMATSAKAADAKETHIVFKQKDGKKLLLSAESMWKTQGDKEGSGRGEAVPSRAKRLFSEALASVLARPDIAGLETPLENIKIDRVMNLWAQPKVDPLKTAVRRDTLKNIKGDINLVEGGLDSLVNDYEAGVDREEIRQGLEANIDYIRSELKRVSEAPMSVAAKTKARTHLKKRLELYSEAKSALDAIDYEEEFDARDADRKGMVSGQVEPGEKLGKNALPHTPMNLRLGSADPRYAEEDTGLAIGREPRQINRQDRSDNKVVEKKLDIVAHPSSGYRERTKHNADSAGVTVAIAVDYNTAGERLTKSVAGHKYLAIPLDTAPEKGGARLAEFMRLMDTTTLNVAGNGIYTLARSGFTQADINQHVFDLIAAAHNVHPITKIVTGGQTGVDLAGAVTGHKLGIPVIVTMPKGFVQRDARSVDSSHTVKEIEQQITDGALAIKSSVESRRSSQQAPKDLKPAVQKPEAAKPRAEPTISKDLDKTNAVKDSFNAMVEAGQAVLRDGVYYLNDASATKYMAGTRAGVIYVNMGKLREQGLSNYVGSSPQKRKVFEQLGITPEAFDTVLGNTKRKAAFLRDHERSHLANRDADKYPRAADGTLDLMHKDAIAMELRATKDALSNEELSKMQKASLKDEPLAVRGTDTKKDMDALVQAGDAIVRKGVYYVTRSDATEAVAGSRDNVVFVNAAKLKQLGKISDKFFADMWLEANKSQGSKSKNAPDKYNAVAKQVLDAYVSDGQAEVRNDVYYFNNTESLFSAAGNFHGNVYVNSAKIKGAGFSAHLKSNNFFLSGLQGLGITLKSLDNALNTVARKASFLRDYELGLAEGKDPAAAITAGLSNEELSKMQKRPQTESVSEAPAVKPARVVLTGNSPYLAKDQRKSDKATKFIGRGSAGSSTAAYAKAWGDRANSGKYEATDRVFVSVNGNRPGALSLDTVELDKALQARARIITDGLSDRMRSFNSGERQLAQYLRDNGYGELAPGEWVPVASKQSAMDVEGQQDNDTDKAAILAEIERIRGKDIKVAFSRFAAGSGSGSYANYYNSVGKRQRIIRIAVNAVNPMGVAWHESLHDFFAMLNSEEVGRGIKKDLADAANAPHVKNKLRELLKDHPAAREQIEKDPEERAAYMYQFWAEGLLSLGNTGTDIFSRIQRLFADLLGVITSTQRAEDLLTALHEGRFADLSTAGEVINSLKGDRLSNKLNKAFPKLSDSLHRLYKTAPDRLRAFQNSHLNELADMFDSDWGSLGFIQRRFQQQGIWENKMLETLEGTTSAERRAALENLQAMKTPVSELEKRIAKFLDDIHQYQVSAGVETREVVKDSETGKDSTKWTPLRKVKNYFPRNWDRSAVERDRAGFVALLQREGNLDSKAANAVADEIISGIGKKDLEESELALGFTPFAPSSQARVLTFITPANAEKFAAFQTKDLALVLNDYVRQTAHRAEYARMFGNQGEVIVKKVLASGITKASDLKEIGTIIQALEGTIENNLSPKMKEFMFGVMSLQNLIVLPLAVVSQMVDPIVLAARTGDLRDAGRAYVTAVKRLVGKEVDGEELSLMLGTISQDSVLDAMGVAYGATYGNKHIRKLNHWFFKLNGMQSFNTSMRIAATVAGERYLIANKNNALALSEVGLKPNDIKVNADGRLNVESTKMQLAMFKFVDQAVLRPSAGNRPVWMSDPRFMLVAHLKQFTFALHNVILKRASRELVAGNQRPWGILMLAMPVMLAADIAKFSFMGTLPPGWGYTDYAVHAIERSGLLGVSDFGIQALQDAGRGRMIGESLLGPSFEHLMMILRALSGEGGVQEVVERTVPGARFVI